MCFFTHANPPLPSLPAPQPGFDTIDLSFLDAVLINLGDGHAARIEEYDDQTRTRCLMGIGPV